MEGALTRELRESTERKQAEEALLKSEKNIEPYLKTSRKAIWRLILMETSPFSTFNMHNPWYSQEVNDGHE